MKLTPRHSGLLCLVSTLCLGSIPALCLGSIPALAQATPPPPPPGTNGFGGIIVGASAAEAAAFQGGLADFTTDETPQTGLGPIFNGQSCVACHQAPAPGGASHRTVTRFGKVTNGVFDPLLSEDGSLQHAKAIAPVLLETVPSDANVTALRLTTPLFGAGLIEAIPDSTLIANAAAEKAHGGAGRVSLVTDVATGQTRVGRFGWKAQHATLLSFDADALNNEIGITNRLFPKAAAPDGNEALLARFVSPTAPIEDQPDSTGLSEVDRLSNFVRLLAPPRGAPSTAASIPKTTRAMAAPSSTASWCVSPVKTTSAIGGCTSSAAIAASSA